MADISPELTSDDGARGLKHAPLPRTTLVIRRKEGSALIRGPLAADNPSMESSNVVAAIPASGEFIYSPQGDRFLCVDQGVWIFDAETGATALKIERPGIVIASWSSMGSFILTWEKMTPENQNNLIVWNSRSGEQVTAFPQKQFDREAWPSVQWSDQEILACRLAADQVMIYKGKEMAGGQTDSLKVAGVTKFQLSPGPAPFKIITFVPEKKGGQPGQVRLYAFPRLKDTDVLCTKSVFRVTNVDFLWSPNGDAVLIKTSNQMDATGKSYYGESFLNYISADGKTSINVQLSKEGPIYDVSWNPKGTEFVAVFGFMPAKAVLFDPKCNPIFDFGTGSRNTVRWAPHGRFLLLGGFGNIAGHMEFWDKNKQKQLGTCKEPSVAPVGWSPDSRYFLTATCFPRLRVDNGFHVWKYDGSLVYRERAASELYQVAFRNNSEIYPDRRASPPRKRGGASGTDADNAGGSNPANRPGSASTAPAPAAGKYVPPHLRGKQGEQAKPSFSLHQYEQAQKIEAKPAPQAEANYPVGYAPEVKKQGKHAKMREKKEAAKQQMKAAEEALSALGHAVPKKDEAAAAAANKKQQQQPKKKKGSQPVVDASQDPERRLKIVERKLAEITLLEEKQQSGVELNSDQLAKVEKKAFLEDEKSSLTAMLENNNNSNDYGEDDDDNNDDNDDEQQE